MAEVGSRYRQLAVVVPVLNEIGEIAAWLRHVARLLPEAVVVVADGGSSDGTVESIEALISNPHMREIDDGIGTLQVMVAHAPTGRGSQLKLGARMALEKASPSHFLFLHVDTALGDEAVPAINEAMEADGFTWGWFDLKLDGPSRAERIIERGISLRARFTGRPTGDQGLLVTRECYLAAGGFAPIPLFEDVDLVARLRRESKGRRLAGTVITSGRRYRKSGHWSTTLRMWVLRIRYWFGDRPDELQRQYDKG
jgi:rSAM/selenodomain-associated transferase 2